MNRLLVVIMVACWGLGCEDDNFTDPPPPPVAVPPPIHGPVPDAGTPAATTADAGAVLPGMMAPGEVEVSKQALWVNPTASQCYGDQPAHTLRVRPDSNHHWCKQFGSNIEITNLGFYQWPDGTSLNDTTNYMVGDLHGQLGKCQKLQAWSESDLWGTTWSHGPICYTGFPGGGYNVWLINPGNLGGGASSLRYETW